jgi:hypothetical protein
MLKNHIKVAFRNIKRQKAYSLINLSGLAVGMAACILILLWVQNELSFDHFHKNAGQLFRALEHQQMSSGRTLTYPMFPTGFGPALEKNYPQVLEAVRFRRSRGRMVRIRDIKFYEDGFAFANPEILKIFTFPLLRGSPDSVLSSPYSVVLTEGMVQKYFGEKDPIGQVIQVDGTHEFQVTGVLKNLPNNSHVKFDFVVPFAALEKYGWEMNDWGSYGIRKVFGASIPAIFFLLSKDFSKWVIAANVIAWPVAFFVMTKWLSSFAFRTSLNILFFVLAAAAVLVIAIITVSFQTLKAALVNPIHSLRHE